MKLVRNWKSLISSGFCVFLLFGWGAAAFALPPNFQDELVLGGLNTPVNLATLPDGRMLVLRKQGEIRIFDPQQLPASSTRYINLAGPNLESGGERGLASLVLDPDFETNGHFYVYYTHSPSARNRISRFTHAGNTANLSSEVLIWQDNENWSECCHFGGGLAFGPDGKLYLTTGEEFDGPQAQDLGRAGGKVIRINKDGSIPNDNPFINTPGALPEVWAYGLRNPYRAHWDLPSGRFYIGEVGGNIQTTAREDLHLGAAGANYGWPDCEGMCSNPAYSDPIYTYAHTGATPDGGAITAGFVYRGNQFPAAYSGAFFFGDYVQGWIKYLKFDAAGQVQSVNDFSDSVNSVVALAQGPEGALYYVDISGSVRRIKFVGGNQPPEITSTQATPSSGPAPLQVTFSGWATDPENDDLDYRWIFGDGAEADGASVSHTYNENGAYTAFLRVSDAGNSTLSEPIPITVGGAPLVQIVEPIDGLLFRALDRINLTGTATDDEPIPEADYEWTVSFVHNAHLHPGPTVPAGSSGSFFDINDSGHDYFDDTAYQIMLTVTDAGGLSGTDVVTIYPDKVDLMLRTNPAGKPVNLDGLPLATPIDYDTLIGFRHTVEAPASFCENDVLNSFVSWSDGNTNATREITVPASNLLLTANYAAAGPCDVPQSGLVLHLSADTGVATSGSTVTSWSDQSGGNNHLTGSGDPVRLSGALNGHAVIDFDGTGDKLERIGNLNGLPAANANRTLYAVVNYGSVGWGGVTYGNPTCNRTFGLAVDKVDGSLAVQGWCAANDFDSNAAGFGAGWQVQSVVHQGGQLTHMQNGAVIDTRSHTYNTQLTELVIGAALNDNPFLSMQVAEVLIYDRALSAAERAQVEQYLQNKYLGGGGGANQPPFADNDSASVVQGGTIVIDVLDGDSDADGTVDPFSINFKTIPDFGTIFVNGNNTLQYVHDGGASTSDSFVYTVRDNLGAESNQATVSITITPSGGQLVTDGLVLQLSADTGVATSGSTVTSWSDQSGGNNHLTGSGDPLQLTGVLNGHAVIDFDGTGDKLERTGNLNGLPAANANRTLYAVVNYRSTGWGGVTYGNPKCNRTFGLAVDNVDGSLAVQGWCGANDFDSNAAGFGAGWQVQSVVHQGGQLTHMQNGSVIDTRSHTYNTQLTELVIGAELKDNPFLSMQVAEVLLYNRALSATEQAQVEQYLQDKYF